MKKLLLTAILLLALPATILADTRNRPAISAGWTYSNITNTDNITAPYTEKNGHNSYYLQLAFNTKPGGEYEAFQEILNFPVFGLGVAFDNHSAMQYKNNSRLGNFIDLYAFMEGAFYKHKYFSIGYCADFGVGFTDTMYDPITNPLEYNIGAPMSVYMKFGPQIKIRPTDKLELIINGNWFHHSTGNTWMPNWGLNDIAIGGEIRYNLDQPETRQVTHLSAEHIFDRKLGIDVYTTYGVHACKTEFKAFNMAEPDPAKKQTGFTSHPRVGIGFDAMYRYCLLCSTGLAIDCNYTWNSDQLRRCDLILHGQEAVDNGPGYSPFSCAVGFAHEFHYGNVSAYCGMSYYLLRRVGIEEDNAKVFQRAGMRFRFPKWKNVFVAWNVRPTQFCNADYFEFQFGIRI